MDFGDNQSVLPWVGHNDELVLRRNLLENSVLGWTALVFTHLDFNRVSALVVLGVPYYQEKHGQ